MKYEQDVMSLLFCNKSKDYMNSLATLFADRNIKEARDIV